MARAALSTNLATTMVKLNRATAAIPGNIGVSTIATQSPAANIPATSASPAIPSNMATPIIPSNAAPQIIPANTAAETLPSNVAALTTPTPAIPAATIPITFYRFEEMPTELQIIVLRLGSAHRHNVQPNPQFFDAMYELGNMRRLVYDTAYKPLLHIGHRWGFKERDNLLRVNRLSRIVALEEWKKSVIAVKVPVGDMKMLREKMEVLGHIKMLLMVWEEPRDDFGYGLGQEAKLEDRQVELKRKFELVE